MTCRLDSAVVLRARAEAVYAAHQAAVSRGDAARGRTLWVQYRDADAIAYAAEREELRAELERLYPVA